MELVGDAFTGTQRLGLIGGDEGVFAGRRIDADGAVIVGDGIDRIAAGIHQMIGHRVAIGIVGGDAAADGALLIGGQVLDGIDHRSVIGHVDMNAARGGGGRILGQGGTVIHRRCLNRQIERAGVVAGRLDRKAGGIGLIGGQREGTVGIGSDLDTAHGHGASGGSAGQGHTGHRLVVMVIDHAQIQAETSAFMDIDGINRGDGRAIGDTLDIDREGLADRMAVAVIDRHGERVGAVPVGIEVVDILARGGVLGDGAVSRLGDGEGQGIAVGIRG